MLNIFDPLSFVLYCTAESIKQHTFSSECSVEKIPQQLLPMCCAELNTQYCKLIDNYVTIPLHITRAWSHQTPIISNQFHTGVMVLSCKPGAKTSTHLHRRLLFIDSIICLATKIISQGPSTHSTLSPLFCNYVSTSPYNVHT